MPSILCTCTSGSKTIPQHDAATSVVYGWDGVLKLASYDHYLINKLHEFFWLMYEDKQK